MNDYTLIDTETGGDENAPYAMQVRVMQASGASDEYRNQAFNTVITVLDHIYTSNNTNVPGWIAQEYSTNANISCNTKFDDGNNWLNNHGFFNNGVFSWVVPCDGGGVATDGGAWENRRQAFTNNNNNSDDVSLFNNIFVQETLHPYIYNNTCGEVQSLIDPSGSDHALGQVISCVAGNCITPMATTYYSTAAGTGFCNRDPSSDNESIELSSCTINAVESSREHAKTNGNH